MRLFVNIFEAILILVSSLDAHGNYLSSSYAHMESRMISMLKEHKKKKIELSKCTEVDVGLELVHAFILDLLVQNSDAAKIFKSKAQDE